MNDHIEKLRDAHSRLFEIKIKGEQAKFTSELEKRGFEWRQMENSVLRITLPDDVQPDIFFRLAIENELQIRHLTATRYSLEDIFAQVIEES